MLYETERTYARLLCLEDLDDYYAFKSDPRVTHGYGMEPYSRQRSDQKLRSMIDIEGKEAYSVAVISKETDHMIGSICLWNLEPEDKRGELGYEFHYDYCSKGYGYEAIGAFIEYMRQRHDYQIFTGCPYQFNLLSNGVLKKLGFEFKYTFGTEDALQNQYEKDYTKEC